MGEEMLWQSILRKAVFPTAVTYSTDHTQTMATFFHGTRSYIIQHSASDNEAENHKPLHVREIKAQIVPELPDSFNIHPATLRGKIHLP